MLLRRSPFTTSARRFLEEYARPRKASWRNDESDLASGRLCGGGRMLVAQITRRQVIDLLDEIRKYAPISAYWTPNSAWHDVELGRRERAAR